MFPHPENTLMLLLLLMMMKTAIDVFRQQFSAAYLDLRVFCAKPQLKTPWLKTSAYCLCVLKCLTHLNAP